MNRLMKYAILTIAITLSANFAWGQDNNDISSSKPNYDFVYINFYNMSGLPSDGIVTVTWEHPTYTNTVTFEYVGTGLYKADLAPNDQISITVRIELGEYIAKKTQPGENTTFDFDWTDFKLPWEVIGPGPGSGTD